MTNEVNKELLSKMSRADKEKLLIALRERETLKKEKVLETFEPHPGQLKFFQSPARVRAVFCGNGWGKTTAAVIELLWQHLECHPYRNTDNTRHTWLIISGFDKAEEYITEIKKWCPPSKMPTFNKMGGSVIRRIDWQNGSQTTIYSHDMDREKYESTNISGLVCDEPPPRDVWLAAYRGLRSNPDYWAIIAGTPIGQPWVYQEIYLPAVMKKDKTIEVFQGNSYENKHANKEQLDDYFSKLSEEERRVRMNGEFSVLQGRVFKEFSRLTHMIPAQSWPEDWPVYVAVDPHTRKKSTAVWVGVTSDDDLVVINETAADDIPKLAAAIAQIEKQNKYRIVCRRIDNSGSNAGWKAESAIDILRTEGKALGADLRFTPMRNEEKAVLDGITKMRNLMRPVKDVTGKMSPRFYVMEHCLNVLTDLEMYGWDASRNEKEKGMKEAPKKIYDDFVDPIRYIVMSNPRYNCALDIIDTFNKNEKFVPYHNKPVNSFRNPRYHG